MTDNIIGGDAFAGDFSHAGLSGGINLGTLHEQRFYAIRANGDELRFPFSAQPFTTLVDMSSPVDDEVLKGYAASLIAHGCVQAVCRGEESHRLVAIFNKMAEKGELDHNGAPFTSMEMDDEPLPEAIQYFVLPCGLAQTGLLVVIGGHGDFQKAIDGFSTAAGAIKEDLSTPVYAEDDLVCFVAN